MKELLSLDIDSSKQISALNIKKSASIGTFYIQDCSIKPVFTFLDFKINRKINIVPIVVIDYSLSNLTFEANKCIHTLKEGADNVYKDVIYHLMDGYRHLSDYMMGFGIGAKTIPKRGEASDCFSLTGDIFNPTFELPELYKMYSNSMRKVELSFPINFSKVL